MTKKAKVNPQVTVGKEYTTYKTDGSTDVGKEIAKSIRNVLEANNVGRNAILGSIAEGVIILLSVIAKNLGYGQKELINIFGKSLIEADIEFKTNEHKREEV